MSHARAKDSGADRSIADCVVRNWPRSSAMQQWLGGICIRWTSRGEPLPGRKGYNDDIGRRGVGKDSRESREYFAGSGRPDSQRTGNRHIQGKERRRHGEGSGIENDPDLRPCRPDFDTARSAEQNSKGPAAAGEGWHDKYEEPITELLRNNRRF